MYFVYILELCDGRYYIGQTQDVEARVIRHQTGQSRYTKKYRPLKLVYYERVDSRSEAVRREHYLKSLKSREALQEIMKLADGPIV